MIYVSVPIRSRKYSTPTFTCYHCKGEFRIRNTVSKRYCVDCEDEVEQQKTKAIQAVGRAIRAGKIQPPANFKCVDCGDPADRYDHRDYGEPLVVEPVCCSCNGKRGPAKLKVQR